MTTETEISYNPKAKASFPLLEEMWVERGDSSDCHSIKGPKANRVDLEEITEDVRSRLASRIIKGGEDDCWPWVGNEIQNYGRLWVKNRLVMAHRVAYMIAKGEIPKGMVIRHTCNNGRCCNPNHLIYGTQAQNNADKVEAKRAPHGSGHFKAKLCEEMIAKIRNDPRDNGVIGSELGVHRSIICKIKNRKIWKHVP